jgi:hypothetical protein
MKTKLLALTVTLLLATLSIAQNPPVEPPPPVQTAAQPVAEPPVIDVAPAPTRRETYRTRTVLGADGKPAAEQQRADAELFLTKIADFQPYQQKMEKGSYVGIATSPIPAVLREQLKLQSGVGLVVDRVEPKSPAEAAGVKAYDVIQKLDDQLLVNPHQFGVLVRTLKPEQEVTLTVIRETKPTEIKIKPIEKELPVLDEMAAMTPTTVWRNDRVNAGKVTLTTPRPGAAVGWGGGPGGADNAPFDRTEMVTIAKDNLLIKTSLNAKGQRTLTATDTQTGKVIFDGPVDTEEQRKALPPAVAEQFQTMDKMVLARPTNIRALPADRFAPGRRVEVRLDNGNLNANALPRPKTVSGSDDEYTWEFTTKTGENGNPELELLLLDKNGKILFQGPFSRTRDLQTLPPAVSQRLSSSPWDIMLEDLKSTTGPGGVLNVNFDAAPRGPVK